MRWNALRGRRGLWCRQLGDTGEGTFDAIAGTMRDYGGYDLLVQKVMDGTAWVGEWDAATAIYGINHVLMVRGSLADQGIAMAPCVVPRGQPGEAELHGQLAAVAGCLVVDAEPYTGFYDQVSPDKFATVYSPALRQAAGDAYLVVQPDPRSYGWSGINMPAAAAYYDACAAQHYVGWTSIGWRDVGLELQVLTGRVGQAFQGKDVYITWYGVEGTQLAGQFLARALEQQRADGSALVTGDHGFRLGVINADQLRYFGGLPRTGAKPIPPPWKEPPPPPPPPLTVEQMKLGFIRATLDEDWAGLRDGVGRLFEEPARG